jgi:ABC-type Fe3+ transport system permease subunit
MFIRLMTALAGWIAGLLLAVPLLSLVLAAIVDMGPEGRVRLTLFPLVLGLYDPVLATSLVQSVGISAAVAVGSSLLGVVLGVVLARRPFWGRPPLRYALGGLTVMPPAFLALGLLGLLEHVVVGSQGEASGVSSARSTLFPMGWRWWAWMWAGWIPGTALVLEVTVRELNASSPNWILAARLAGTDRLRIWWTLSWPQLRPRIVAAARVLFVLTLADPGPPLILGLRRTIGFQVVVSALGRDTFPRAAAAGLLAIVVSFTIRSVLRRRETSAWTRTADTDEDSASRHGTTEPPALPEGRAVGLLPVPLLLLGAVAAWLPVAGLCRLAFATGSPGMDSGSSPLLRAGGQSLVLAISVALSFFLLARTLPWDLPNSKRASTFWKPLGRTIGEVVSPLVTGLGVLAAIRLVHLAFFGTWHPAVEGPGSIYLRELPGLIVVLGVLLVQVPLRLCGPGDPRERQDVPLRRFDQARLLGAGRFRAQSMARTGGRAIPFGSIVAWSILASTAVAPAIVLGGPEPAWGAGPAVVILSQGPCESRRQAALLALAAAGVNAGALAIARAWTRLDA